MILRLTRYILKKILTAIPTLLGLSILIFYTTTFLPLGIRVNLFLSQQRIQNPWAPDPTPELIKKYGLDEPFPIQYMKWLEEVLKGNLGWSYLIGMPVTKVIMRYFPATIELVLYAAPLIFIGGYKLGIFSAKRVNSRAPHEDPIDFAIRSITTIGYSIPSFCLALLLLIIFYLGLNWVGIERLGLAANTYVHSPEWTQYTRLYTIDALLNGQLWIFFDALKHLMLPVITLTTQTLPIVARITRSSMIDELIKPHIVTARAMGLNEGIVMNHAKKGAQTPVFTVTGILFASMLTGVIVTEHIFAIKGVGYLVVASTVSWRIDYPLLVGLSLVFCVIFMLINLIVDITYAYIDPRVQP